MSGHDTPLGKVIPRDAVATSFGSAQPEVRRLLQSVEEESRQAYSEAELRGAVEGRAAGRQEFMAATAGAVKAVRDDLFALEPMLTPLVLQAVEKILGQMPPEAIARAGIETVLREAGSGISVTLRASPDDIELMRSAWGEIRAAQPDLADTVAAIEPDAGLQRGEMVLETLKGRTHFGIAYQIARLRYGLTGSGQ